MNPQDLLIIRLTENYGVVISIDPLLLGIFSICIIVAIILIIYRYCRTRGFGVVEIDLQLGNIGHVKLRVNNEVIRIAHQAWAEIETRKAALEFDEENDVILEIYNSWYEMFKELRELAKSVPAESIRDNQSARDLIAVLVRALNDGVRPHLTKWQARFRNWYDYKSKDLRRMEPQELQKRYPEYGELIKDLRKVNRQIKEFAEKLGEIAHGRKRWESPT